MWLPGTSGPLAKTTGTPPGFPGSSLFARVARREGMTAYGVVAIALVVLGHYYLGRIFNLEFEFATFVVVIALIALIGGGKAAMATAVVAAVAGLSELMGKESNPDGQLAGLLLALAAAAILLQFRQRTLAKVERANARARDALEFADELNLLVEGAHEHAICMLDTQGRVLIWNKGGQRLFGWTENEAVGRHVQFIWAVTDATAGKTFESLKQAEEHGRVTYEGRLQRRDGSEFQAYIELTALRDEKGRLRGFGKVVHDITRERTASRRIELSEAYLDRLVAAVPDALVVADATGIILTFNDSAERMFGYQRADILGKRITALMQPIDAGRHPAAMADYVARGDSHINGMERILTAMRSDGTTFPHKIVVEEVGSGDERLFMAFIRDMTESQDTASRLAEMQAGLIHVSRLSAMGTMASTLAHELNQPITAIANYIGAANDLLKSPEPGKIETVREALEYAEADTMRAGEIIRRLRRFVARGHVEQAPASLKEIINAALGLATMDAHFRSITVHPCTSGRDYQVNVDKIQVQQVLVNLIRNAFEALESCHNRNLYITCRPDADKTVRVTVGDSGQGVASTIAGDLFGAFATTKTDGMGVGLSICRTIVEANGGRIWYEPRDGGGAQFHFTLKRAGSAAETAKTLH